MDYRWTGLSGPWELIEPTGHAGVFHGREIAWADSQGVQRADGLASGIALCDAKFSGGTITATVRFDSITPNTSTHYPSAGIVFWSGPNAATHLVAGLHISSTHLFAIRGWDGKQWLDFDGRSGVVENMEAKRAYHLQVNVSGSLVKLISDGVEVVSTKIPFNPLGRPVGVWALSKDTVHFYDFEVTSTVPTAFIVMQFTPPYNELHEHVLKPVCAEFGITAIRADDTYGPGVIIQDIVRQMLACDVVIAEITPTNANVYYEVGYAHALGKPLILIAAKGTVLPFDVSPFRVLFYDNSIDGKMKAEAGLRKHLKAIFEKAASL